MRSDTAPAWIMTLVLTGWISSAPAHVAAQTGAHSPLSLGAAQREARTRAPEAHVLHARTRGAELLAADATRALRSDPTLSLHYDRDIEGDGEHSWGAGLAFTLDVAGSWAPRADAAAAERAQAQYEATDGLLELDQEVANAVAELAFAQRKHERAQRVAALQAIIADATRQRFDLGQAGQLEDDAAQLDLAASRAELARANSELERDAAHLGRTLGRSQSAGLRVEDPAEVSAKLPDAPPAKWSDDAPAVRAAAAAVAAAEHAVALEGRLVWPTPTLGLELDRERRAIPSGAFAGTTDPLSAAWSEWRFGVKLELPLGLIDRNGERRAQASARLLASRAQLEIAHADARAQWLAASLELRTAQQAYRELEPTAAVVERSYRLLEQAARAGALDAVTRAQALQRLNDAAHQLDAAVRDLRLARARFTRRASGSSPIAPTRR